ncbi:hypothetical protein TTHERM_001224651 (macronuclear) [Tetrahymena thermophila SB210]|uniref:Uncharacterized protein n=1 Tax=Tetrahymena thermophila (strain SB210) TaxID=312017 RepID=W7XDI6_TETTS|nr:hypothetical protein TTHERM_001224651 [Tetrahymena thermophila SB210]EWS71901.1 hypothetical protein TTHERM_001224651 [Tetrahymena thermophila SB210]|eukprot:XP_012655558.1 hypothetical protein TTHERM_001224651 [Tetrahymena thermophila SB210]
MLFLNKRKNLQLSLALCYMKLALQSVAQIYLKVTQCHNHFFHYNLFIQLRIGILQFFLLCQNILKSYQNTIQIDKYQLLLHLKFLQAIEQGFNTQDQKMNLANENQQNQKLQPTRALFHQNLNELHQYAFLEVFYSFSLANLNIISENLK